MGEPDHLSVQTIGSSSYPGTGIEPRYSDVEHRNSSLNSNHQSEDHPGFCHLNNLSIITKSG